MYMTIQVYPDNEQEEHALLDFLKSGQYHYKPIDDKETIDDAFIAIYNKEIAEAEPEIDASDSHTHDEVKSYFASKRGRSVGN